MVIEVATIASYSSLLHAHKFVFQLLCGDTLKCTPHTRWRWCNVVTFDEVMERCMVFFPGADGVCLPNYFPPPFFTSFLVRLYGFLDNPTTVSSHLSFGVALLFPLMQELSARVTTCCLHIFLSFCCTSSVSLYT